MINMYIPSMRYSVLLNGVLIGYFQSTQGIKQGAPYQPIYSPYAWKSYLGSFKRSRRKGNYTDSKSQALALKYHTFFVDDMFVFYRATLAETHELIDILNKFSQIIGQEINYKKQACQFSKCIPNITEE